MIHTQVYGFFQTCLPDQAKEVKEYFPMVKTAFESVKLMDRNLYFR